SKGSQALELHHALPSATTLMRWSVIVDGTPTSLTAKPERKPWIYTATSATFSIRAVWGALSSTVCWSRFQQRFCQSCLRHLPDMPLRGLTSKGAFFYLRFSWACRLFHCK